MKRRLTQSVNMSGQLVIEELGAKPKSKPRKYVSTGVIERYVLERELHFASIGKGNNEYLERLKGGKNEKD